MKKLLVLLAVAIPLIGCGQKNSDPENYKKVDSLADYVTHEKAVEAVADIGDNCISVTLIHKRTGYSTKETIDLGDGYFYDVYETSDPAKTKMLYYHDSDSAGQLYTVTEKPTQTQSHAEDPAATNQYNMFNDMVRNSVTSILMDSNSVLKTYMTVDSDSLKYYVGKTTLKLTGKGTKSGENFAIVLEKETLFPKSFTVNFYFGEDKVKAKDSHTFDCDATLNYYMPDDIGYIED